MLINTYRQAAAAEVLPVIRGKYYDVLMDIIRSARYSIAITIYNGYCSEDNKYHRVKRVFDELGNKKKEGIHVRVLLHRGKPGDQLGTKNEKLAEYLARKDIQVRTAGPGVFLHSKLIIVDKRFVLLGSHNFTINSWFKNYETSVMIESPQVADVYYRYYQKLWTREI